MVWCRDLAYAGHPARSSPKDEGAFGKITKRTLRKVGKRAEAIFLDHCLQHRTRFCHRSAQRVRIGIWLFLAQWWRNRVDSFHGILAVPMVPEQPSGTELVQLVRRSSPSTYLLPYSVVVLLGTLRTAFQKTLKAAFNRLFDNRQSSRITASASWSAMA